MVAHYPLVKELPADGIPVTVACGVLKLARAPYRAAKAQGMSQTKAAAAAGISRGSAQRVDAAPSR